MFDVERLLGKIVGEAVSGGSGSRGGGNSMLGGLTSGSGLMTMIGLGVGAFEILKQQGPNNQSGGVGQMPPPPPGSGTAGFGVPPPPPGGVQAAPPPPPPMPGGMPVVSSPVSALPAGGLGNAELAVRMIQVMVAAAHADGTMDQEEERAVLDKMRGTAELSQEEKMFLLDELHRPKSIEAITAGISDPSVAKTMYLLAASAIEIDTAAERAWLDQLARQLGLSRELQSFIEEQR